MPRLAYNEVHASSDFLGQCAVTPVLISRQVEERRLLQGFENLCRCTSVELEDARSGILKQMLRTNIEHASHYRRPVIQLPAIRKQLYELFGVPETRKYEELWCDGGRRLRQLDPVKPVAFGAIRREPHPGRFNHMISAKPITSAGVTDELRHYQEAELVGALCVVELL